MTNKIHGRGAYSLNNKTSGAVTLACYATATFSLTLEFTHAQSGAQVIRQY